MLTATSASGSESDKFNYLYNYLYLIFLVMFLLNGLIFGWVTLQRLRRECDLQEAERIQVRLQQVNQRLRQEWIALTSPQKNRPLYEQRLGLAPAEQVVILEELKM